MAKSSDLCQNCSWSSSAHPPLPCRSIGAAEVKRVSSGGEAHTQPCSSLLTSVTGLSGCVHGKAPFYCVCQGQSGKRYVRNSHVSCPHSSIGAAVPLPAETQKANFAFISLQVQLGYFYSCIVRRAQRQSQSLSSGSRAALQACLCSCSAGEQRNERTSLFHRRIVWVGKAL